METWKREMVSFVSTSRADVKYSLTEKCANWITGEPEGCLTTTSNVEQIDNTSFSGSSERQSTRNSGVDPASKSNARNSASSCGLSGREAAATHWKRRRAYSQFCSSISSKVRAYVASSVVGNSFSA